MINDLNEGTAIDKTPHPAGCLHAAALNAGDGKHLAAFPYSEMRWTPVITITPVYIGTCMVSLDVAVWTCQNTWSHTHTHTTSFNSLATSMTWIINTSS